MSVLIIRALYELGSTLGPYKGLGIKYHILYTLLVLGPYTMTLGTWNMHTADNRPTHRKWTP